MAIVQLDIYSADDLGTPLVTLTDEDVQAGDLLRVAQNELGSGQFKIHRAHAAATAANLSDGNYVKVTLPHISANPKWGFWLDSSDATILSQNEEGGEYVTVGGAGPLAILNNAALLDDFYNGPLGGAARGNYDVPGYWTWATEPYGAILVRVLEEGQLEPGLPLDLMSWDFNRTNDSTTTPWPDIQELIQLPIGTDGLTAYQRLIESGNLFVVPNPDTLLIQAYGTNPGIDRTSTTFATNKVRFEKGINIQTELVKRGENLVAPTHAIVLGMETAYRQVVVPGYVAPPTGKPGRWIQVDYPESNDPDLLDDVGAHALAHANALQQALELEVLPGANQAIGRYLPFLHYNVGDLATLHTGSGTFDYTNSIARIAGFRIAINEATDDATGNDAARSLSVVVELNRSDSSDDLSGSSDFHDPLGPCPFFVRDIPSEPQQIRFRTWGPGANDGYNHIGAPTGDADTVDAYVEVDISGIDIFWYDTGSSEVSNIYMSGGDLFFEATYSEDHTLHTIGNNSRYIFNGGYGIQFPYLTSDPSGAQSHEGQVFWNSSSNKLRVYDGSTWSDIGTGGGGGGDATWEVHSTDVNARRLISPITDLWDTSETARLQLDDDFVQLDVSDGGFLILEAGEFTVRAGAAGPKIDLFTTHDLSGGNGLVVPRLAADPAGGSSQEGQIYFDTVNKVFRGFDGTSWGELALT